MVYQKVMLSRNQKIGIAVGATGLIILLVIGWWARSGRQNLLQQSLVNLDQAASYHVKAELIMNLPPRQPGGAARRYTLVTGRVEGDVKKNEHGTPELTGHLFGEMRGSGARLFATGDLRILNDKVIFWLEEFPVALNPSRKLLKRWTHVPGVLLQTANGELLRQTTAQVAPAFKYDGTAEVDGIAYAEYRGRLSPEHKRELITLAQHHASHNHAWNILARLLNAYPTHAIEILVDDSTKQVRQILAVFGQVVDGKFVRRAAVKVDFTDFGKAVTIDQPEQQLTARPEVFSALFKTGEITPQ